MTSLYITKLISKTGNPFLALVADLGYKKLIISIDVPKIYELSPVPPSTLYALNPEEKVVII